MKKIIVGTALGLAAGAVVTPILMAGDLVNLATRVWFTPLATAFTGGFIASKIKESK